MPEFDLLMARRFKWEYFTRYVTQDFTRIGLSARKSVPHTSLRAGQAAYPCVVPEHECKFARRRPSTLAYAGGAGAAAVGVTLITFGFHKRSAN